MPAADKADKMEDHRSLHVHVGKLSGSEFDREYIRAMVEDHEQTLNDIESKADGAANDHVRHWAARTLPFVQKHLERAKQIHDAPERR